MKTLTICVGSACHMKGSHRVIDKFDGARVDERQIYDLTRENAEEVFLREILGN